MRIAIKTPEDLGRLVRSVRRAQGVRQEDLALMVPASHVFVIDAERGKPTIQFGKLLALLRELGIELTADAPDGASERSDG